MTQSGNPTPQQPPAAPPAAPPRGSGWTAAPPPAGRRARGSRLWRRPEPGDRLHHRHHHPVRDQRDHHRHPRRGRAERLDVDQHERRAINDLVSYNPVVGVIQALIFTAINGVYFIYLWRHSAATIGQRVLGLQVGNAADGATITQEQGIKRWIALGAPFSIAQALNPLPGLGILIGLAAFVWFIALLYTTATSPTKQGIHDKYAGTIVAKAARTVA